MKKYFLLINIILGSISGFSQDACVLTVKVENIKDIKGSLKIAIYNHKDHFLTKEVMSDGKTIEDNKIQFSFKGLIEGEYAISLFHDENDNGKLDSNFIGIPSEPYAFSNNAKGRFGPPSFDQCKFELKKGSQEIVISL